MSFEFIFSIFRQIIWIIGEVENTGGIGKVRAMTCRIHLTLIQLTGGIVRITHPIALDMPVFHDIKSLYSEETNKMTWRQRKVLY